MLDVRPDNFEVSPDCAGLVLRALTYFPAICKVSWKMGGKVFYEIDLAMIERAEAECYAAMVTGILVECVALHRLPIALTDGRLPGLRKGAA